MAITYPKTIWTPDSAGITVASCFDGMSCGLLALLRARIPVKRYYAYEIDKHAIDISRRNFPQIVQMGNIMDRHAQNWRGRKVDLLIGGSPCQGFSNAGGGLAFDDPRSKLFFEFVDFMAFLRENNPDMEVLLENVKMRKEWVDIITSYMGVEPILINSALVSGQRRERYYWTNISGITQPAAKGTKLDDILETDVSKKYLHSDEAITYMNRQVSGGRTHWDFAHHSDSSQDKSAAVVANFYKGVPYNVLIDRKLYLSDEEIARAEIKYKGRVTKSGKRMGTMRFPDKTDKVSKCLTATVITSARETIHIKDGIGIRKLTPTECERLQTLPDGYTAGVSDTQRYKMIGNGWTVDTVAHILSFAKF